MKFLRTLITLAVGAAAFAGVASAQAEVTPAATRYPFALKPAHSN